jgi:hypothetical protein
VQLHIPDNGHFGIAVPLAPSGRADERIEWKCHLLRCVILFTARSGHWSDDQRYLLSRVKQTCLRSAPTQKPRSELVGV